MDITAYLSEIRTLHASGQTTEHSFRPALERLFKSIDPALTVINEPRRTVDVGAPDFVFQRGDVAIGWIRRTRIGGDSWDVEEVPLGETSESYDIDILDGAALKRTLSSAVPSVLYSAAAQTADFGSLPATIDIAIAQRSSTFGRGIAARATV